MRVWDISPGYLSRQRLLGEHRELHAVDVILTQGKTGYSRHPETVRWNGALGGLAWRHAHLVAEMTLRGYTDRTPLKLPGTHAWPTSFVTPPHEQFELLRMKYAAGDAGRIPLPRSPQQLWAQHKYSVLARSPQTYRRLGRDVAALRPRASLIDLARELTLVLRQPPVQGRLLNALEHMWGHVSAHATAEERQQALTGPPGLLAATRTVAIRVGEKYLCASTALGELGAYLALDASGDRTRPRTTGTIRT